MCGDVLEPFAARSLPGEGGRREGDGIRGEGGGREDGIRGEGREMGQEVRVEGGRWDKR